MEEDVYRNVMKRQIMTDVGPSKASEVSNERIAPSIRTNKIYRLLILNSRLLTMIKKFQELSSFKI